MAQVICVDISKADEALYGRLYARLDRQRQQRADRYRRREDALRCAAAGALLSLAVRQELGASTFTVETAPGGKPYLAEYRNFHYNLSHSGNWVAIAWAGTEVGLDVQQHRSGVDREMLAKRFFTPEEQDYIHGEDPDGQRFYRVWTGKESYLKYLGTGLAKSLDSFSILSPEVAPLLRSRTLPGNCSLTLCTREKDWNIQLLDVTCLAE